MWSLKSVSSLAVLTVSILVGVVPIAVAQSQDGTTAAQDDQATEGSEEGTTGETASRVTAAGEIVVTARMREEKLIEVPESISVFGADLIEDAHIREIADFSRMTPGATVQQGFQGGDRPIIVFRGVGQIGGSAPSVILLSDGVYLPVGDPLRNQMFDIERIEVVKGPQGSLYGRDTIGGVVNVITQRPSPGHTGRFQSSYMDAAGETNFVAAFNLPISQDRVIARVSGGKLNSDGYFKNLSGADHDFRDESFLRTRLLAMLGEAWELDLRLAYNGFDNGYNGAFYSYDADTFIDDVGGVLNAIDYDKGFNKRDVYDAAVRLNGEVGFATLTSITQYVDAEQNLVQDADFQFAPPLQIVRDSLTTEQTYSQELRLASSAGDAMQWLAGAFYESSEMDFSYHDDEVNFPLGPLGGAANEQDTTRYALFGQLGGVLASKLNGNLSLRYDSSTRDLRVLTPTPTEDSVDFDRVTPKASLIYAWTENSRTYLTYAEGFRSGAFDATTNIPYDDEILKSIELGFKGEYLDQRLDVAAAVYHYRYTDQQVAVVIEDPISGNLVVTTENLGESETLGFEIELGYRPTRSLVFTLGGDLLDTEILEDPDPSVIGNKTPFSTDYTVSLTGQHTCFLRNGSFLVSRLEYYLQGPQTWDKGNQQVQKAYGLLAASVAYEARHWGVALRGENLTDQEYNDQIFANFGVPGLNATYPGLPRRVTATLKLRY